MEQDRALLLQLSFSSRAQAGLPDAVLARIEQQSRDFNEKHALTGELRLVDGVFFGVTEGASHVILHLAARIFADTRHSGIEIESFGPIACRRYSSWTCNGFSARRQDRWCARDMAENVTLLRPAASRSPAAPLARNQTAKVFRF